MFGSRTDKDILELLKSNELFASLNTRQLNELARCMQPVHLVMDEVLFHYEDAPDGLYLVVSGKLNAILPKLTEEEQIVGELNPGDVVGELGVISDKPRSLTIKALRQTHLLKLSKKDFEYFFYKKHPELLLNITKMIVSRSQDVIHHMAGKRLGIRIVLLQQGDNALFEKFIEKFKYFITKLNNIRVYDLAEMPLLNHEDHIKYAKSIHEAQHQHQTVITIMTDKSNFCEECLLEADELYVFVDGDPERALVEMEQFISRPYISHLLNAVVFLYRAYDNIVHAKLIRLGLEKEIFNTYYNIAFDYEEDIKRFIRIITGNAIVLVLSGGGARGWAQIGLVRALFEKNIPIDMVGGSSAGAVVGAYYLLAKSHQEFLEYCKEIALAIGRPLSIKNLTIPIVSILSGKKGTLAFKKTLKDIAIENLWKPYFCISSNISASKKIIHRRGELWKAVRASSSIPGVVPPVIYAGELHVDGGVVDNLPVRVAKHMVGRGGFIIACDVSESEHDPTKYNFPEVLPFFISLLVKLRLTGRRFIFPQFSETILKSLLLSALMTTKENQEEADLLITPKLGKYNLFDASAWQEMEQIGYKAAVSALENNQALQEIIHLFDKCK